MEETKLYRPILLKSWQILKKFKTLWFFGFFSAIVGGGEYEILANTMSNPLNSRGVVWDIMNNFSKGWENGIQAGGNAFSNIGSAIMQNPVATVLAILIFIVTGAIAAFLIYLSIVSQIGLINNLNLAAKNRHASISDGFKAATKIFWPVFWATAIFKIVIGIVIGLFVQALISFANFSTATIVIYLILFTVFVALVLIISFLWKYQLLYLVLKKQKISKALKSSWKLFAKNWLVSIEMAALMLAIYLVAAFLTMLAWVVIWDLFLILFIKFILPLWLIGVALLLVLLVALLAAFFITAILTVFQWSAWVLLFNRLDSGDGVAKLVRYSQELPSYFVNK